jgi:methyl-accepting chemotaxis protein
VRNLAQRSAEAARQISELIRSSVQRVEDGASQVTMAGETMEDIVKQVQKVNDLIGEIRNATRAQTDDIAQVSQAVCELDANTQGNALLVRDSAAAADSLKTQANSLVATVNTFRIEREKLDAGLLLS